MQPRSFSAADCHTSRQMLRRILAEGERGKVLLSCPLSVLGWSTDVAGVWWVAPLEAGCGLFRIAPIGSLLPSLLLWRGCGGVVGL